MEKEPKKVIEENTLLNENYLEQKYQDSYLDKKKKIKNEFYKSLGDYQKEADKLKGTEFSFTEEGFCFVEKSNDAHAEFGRISNVLVYPKKQTNYIGPSNKITKSIVTLGAIIAPSAEVLPEIEVPLEQVESGVWLQNPKWWSKIRLEKQEYKKYHIESLSKLKKFMEVVNEYEFVGMASINGKKGFLHAGGVIGIDDNVKVDLGDKKLKRINLCSKEVNIEEALRCIPEIKKIANPKVTVPMLSIVGTAPVTSIFKELEIDVATATCIVGSHQAEITDIVSTIFSPFGIDKNQTTMNLNDSVTNAKKTTEKCKDVILVTNYFTSTTSDKKDELKKVENYLENIIPIYTEQENDINSGSGEFVFMRRIFT